MLGGRHFVTMIVAVSAAAGLTMVTGSGGAMAGTRAAAPRAALAATWGAAREMPGTAALNQGGDAQVNSVSCGSPGNCSAGGVYSDSSGHGQGFIANRT